MTEIDVPDWVVEEALLATSDPSETSLTHAEYARAIITAALGAWVAQRGTTYYDTRDSSLSTQVDWEHPEPVAKQNVYTLRQEKPE